MSDKIVKLNTQLGHHFVFTQSKLQDFLDCPRRFYLKYIEEQRWPAPVTEPQERLEEALRYGQLMHQYIEQHLSGVPHSVIEQQFSTYHNEQLQKWWQVYLTHYQNTIAHMRAIYPEMLLSTHIDEYTLLAKYDVLMTDGSNNLIAIDWKTGKLPKPSQLEERMQTIVYLLVLYQASTALLNQRPSSITLRYISLESNEIQNFNVTALSVAALEMRILEVIEQIKVSSFDKVINETPCRYCIYRGLCGRGKASWHEDSVAMLSDLDEDIDWYSDIDNYTVEF